MPANDSTTVNDLIAQIDESDKGNISDGYHTFEELYEHRIALFCALCAHYQSSNRMATGNNKGQLAYKSRKHFDGTKMPGWFIVQLYTTAGQLSYHFPEKYWDQF